MNTKNKTSSRSTLFIAISIVGLGIFVAFSIAYAQQGIIPCGSSGQPDCNLCHILALIQNIINFVVGPGGGPTTPVGIIYPLATLMIAYGGFVWFTSGGSESRLTQAKGIISSAVWGLVIALASFLIVNTILNVLAGQGISGNVAKPPGFPWAWNQINCSVVPGGTFQPTPSTTTATTTPAANVCLANSAATQVAVRALQSDSTAMRKISFSSNASCGGVSAATTIQELSRGACPSVCFSGCTGASSCPAGGSGGSVTVSSGLILGLHIVARDANAPAFIVTSITSGSHSQNSTHYQGRGVDVVPISPTQQNYIALRDLLLSVGRASRAFCETVNGNNDANCNPTGANRTDHIHADF